MDSFGAVRALATEKHDAMRADADGNGSAHALLTAARKTTSTIVQSVSPKHPALGGGDGALHRSSDVIYISDALGRDLAAFVEAHEFGHYWLETPSDPAVTPRGSDPGIPEENTPLGLRRVEAYSAQELRERYANVFGREFLLPRREARHLFIDKAQTARDIARELTVPIGLVHQQLAVALLLPEGPLVSEEDIESGERPALDDSQKAAAEHKHSPLLVEAGPGTGKTRTLIARIEFLLSKGVPAPSILALTFSNKAAHEIRERVATNMPVAATEIWTGTFHAFGLEILRKFGHLEDVADPVRLLDQADVLAMLEQDLPLLGLDYYLRLYEPLSELRHILGAISRAKDEVISVDDYAAAAERMVESARDETAQLKAAKAMEVARVYKHYAQRMRSKGLVDFADLINRSVEILKNHPEVGDELRDQYRHLLVDEYQDVNRGSALLVKELAGEGEQLWAVGDARQSIYRFRGAAPINTRDFEKDYPKGQRKSLKINYRSREQIVDTFSDYAGNMMVGGRLAANLEARRGPGKEAVDCNVARDRDAEIAGIAATIERMRSQGIAYQDQAVLCRVHRNLERVAAGLEAAGVPVLYLGDLFERPEVRDLLALISFTAEPQRGGLYRLATLPPYQMPLSDVRAFLNYAVDNEKTPLAALSKIDAIPELSELGRVSLGLLSKHLTDTGYKTGPGELLCHVLFNHQSLLRVYLAGENAADQQRRLAIHQFLQFAIENNAVGDGEPKRRLLDWVRHLEVFGDERALREPPAAVEGIDAVRLMTVHASKGLEFKVVHIPTLGAGMFPLRWQGQRCPAPDGLLRTGAIDDHKEEEQCLFYVALSRARDHLSLSRAQRYTPRQGSNASEALKIIAGRLPRPPDGPPTWAQSLPFPETDGDRPDLCVTTRRHDGRDIELFLGCPRRYLYQIVLGLSGGREDNGYVRFHRAVHRVLRWMCTQGYDVGRNEVDTHFATAWRETGPHDHPLEELYRASAQRILDQALSLSRTGIDFGKTSSLMLDDHTISVPIDEIEASNDGTIVRRLRTGRPPSKPDQRHLHAVMLQAGRGEIDRVSHFEIRYLTTNETVSIPLDGVMDSRLGDIRTALCDLIVGRFPANPKNREDCPRCPHYFICPEIPK